MDIVDIFTGIGELIAQLVETVCGFVGLLIEKPQFILPVVGAAAVVFGGAYYFISDALKQQHAAAPAPITRTVTAVPTQLPVAAVTAAAKSAITKPIISSNMKEKAKDKAKSLWNNLKDKI